MPLSMTGYGLPLFGLLIPWPPAWVLWAMIGADLALTGASLRRRAPWPILLLGIAVSLYLALAGLFSIGIVLLLLAIVQTGMLIHRLRPPR